MDMEDLFFVLLIMTVLVAVLWGIVFAMKSKEDSWNNAQPVQNQNAKLVDMQQVPAGQVVIGEIWVMFELENGDRVRLNAKPQNSLVVGDKGVLTWQGKRILKFERNKGF